MNNLCKKRNEIERLFRRLKGFRRIFSRFEKLDVVFLAFIHFALIVEALRVAGTHPNLPRFACADLRFAPPSPLRSDGREPSSCNCRLRWRGPGPRRVC